jgi:hypothetical protein
LHRYRLFFPKQYSIIAVYTVVPLCRKVNVCKYCVHMYINVKMIPVETIPGMGEGRDKGELWRG